MSDVQLGIWRGVLLRLPAESLFRLRAVCKRWRTVIDDPVFVKAHTSNQLSSNSNTVLLRNSAGPPFHPLYYFNLDDINFTVDSPQVISVIPLNLTLSGLSRVPALPLAACNGLLLTAPEYRKRNWNPKKGILEIRNPLTHECLKLPPQDFNLHVEGFGIGHDSVADDYKVVVIDSVRRTHVYSLKSDSWKTAGNCPIDLSNQEEIQRGVFVDGAVHWLSSGEAGVIIAFDVGNENYYPMALPIPNSMDSTLQLDALSGCLFLSISIGGSSRRSELWVMNDYGKFDSWKLLFKLDIGGYRPVAYMKDINRLLMQQNHEELIWFDIESKSKKRVRIHGIRRVCVQVCVGSLFRLHDSCGRRVQFQTSRMKMGFNKLTFCVESKNRWGDAHDNCYKLDSVWYNPSSQGTKEIHPDVVHSVPVPLDICREIFLLLPAKSLVRFRAVCHTWRAIIDEPGFVKSYNNKQLSSNTIIIQNNSGPPFYRLYSFDLNHLDFTDGIQKVPALGFNPCGLAPLDHNPYGLSRQAFSVAACHGLMLIAREKTFEIWNPTTHERLGLPRGKYNLNGAFFGLGYDESADDYKVVVIHSRDHARDRETYVFRTHVYSLRSDSWRMIGNVPNTNQFLGPEGHGVFFHGALHWLFSGWPDCTIVSFDLGTEKYRHMKLPTLRKRTCEVWREQCLYVLGGCLILNDYGIALDGYDRHYDVYVMKDYGDEDSWVKLFFIDEKDYEIYDNLNPVAYMKEGMRVFLQETCRGLYIFDFEKNSYKKVGIHGLSSNLYAHFVPCSIFRLHDNCGVDGRRRRRRRIIRRELSEMKLCDAELYFCVKDANCFRRDHENCFRLDSNWDCLSSED